MVSNGSKSVSSQAHNPTYCFVGDSKKKSPEEAVPQERNTELANKGEVAEPNW